MEGKKFDGGKPDLSLVYYNMASGIAQALKFGENKYGRYNYLGGMKWTRLASAALRHLLQWAWGETFDDESGLNHLYHAAANIQMLIDFQTGERGEDDRFKG